MISFAKLRPLLESRNYAISRLKREKIVSGRTYDTLISAIRTPIKEGLSISAVDALCTLLNCQPGDIMEYVPDQPVTDPEAAPQADQPQNNP